MARPWRLRHKLGLGLALVVGSVALLLGGALFGQSSFVANMQTTERKLNEIQVVIQLRDHIHRIPAAGQMPAPGEESAADLRETPADREKRQIKSALADARKNLGIYQSMLQTEAARRGVDPDDGRDETELIRRIEGSLAALDLAVEAAQSRIVTSGPERLIDDRAVRKAYDDLKNHNGALLQFLVSDIEKSRDRSLANLRRSQYVAGSATFLAVVLVVTLMYYFRVWVFGPIRELQAGVQRVHRGDFGHPITLASGDELQELATEFNLMTARLRDMYADLARQVNERTRQLVRSERMVSVGFLAAGVAHEINNPLASIAFCAEALERRLQDVLTRNPGEAEVIQKYLRMMQDEAQRCKQITHKLLDFSRSGGKQEPTDLSHLVRDVIEVAECLPAARGKKVVFQTAGALIAPVRVPEVKGVVLNILVNGLESMDTGGTITVSLADHGDAAELTFADTGCGMTAEVLEHIFEPFFTRNRTGNGTGLGLATSHLIIDQHGGSIAAASGGPGKGSTFTVRLPVRGGAAGDPAEDVKTLAFPGMRAVAAAA